MADENWRITIRLGSSSDCATVAEELRPLLRDEGEVTKADGERELHVWCATTQRARAAVPVIEELVSDGEIVLHHWSDETGEWEAASLQSDAFDTLPDSGVFPNASPPTEQTDVAPWVVRTRLPTRRAAIELHDSVGLPCTRRWRTLRFDCAGREAAQELAAMLREQAPPGTEIEARERG